MRTIQRKFTIIATALVMALIVTCAVIGGRGTQPAFADTGYTNVLSDLYKDSTFRVSDYPINSTDYSIEVIQIAESVDGELFLYTYQPCQNTRSITATEINMSLSEDFAVNNKGDTVIEVLEDNQGSDKPNSGGANLGDGSDGDSSGGGFGGGGGRPRTTNTETGRSRAQLYELTLLNTSSVFCKYKVNGFTVSGDSVRYYNIASIYREFIKGIDKSTGNDNTVTAVSFAVGQIWKVSTVSGDIKYEMTEVETVEITSKYVGTVQYPNGTKWFTTGACDSHFVAFSTNKQIDKLLEADVTYISQTYDKTLTGTKHGNIEKHNVGLVYDQTAGNTVNGIFAKSYTWKRIQSVSEFISDVKPDDEIKKALSGKQWILNFAETEYTVGAGVGTSIIIGWLGSLIGSQYRSGTNVSDVSILRLKFETDGQVYNLGAVDNKQTGSDNVIKPNDGENGFVKFVKFIWDCFKSLSNSPAWWQIAVVVITVVVALIVVGLTYKFIKWFIGCFRSNK